MGNPQALLPWLPWLRYYGYKRNPQLSDKCDVTGAVRKRRKSKSGEEAVWLVVMLLATCVSFVVNTESGKKGLNFTLRRGFQRCNYWPRVSPGLGLLVCRHSSSCSLPAYPED